MGPHCVPHSIYILEKKFFMPPLPPGAGSRFLICEDTVVRTQWVCHCRMTQRIGQVDIQFSGNIFKVSWKIILEMFPLTSVM